MHDRIDLRALLLFAVLMGSVGCGTPRAEAPRTDADPPLTSAPTGGEDAACPATATSPEIPGTRPEHRTLEYWLKQLEPQVGLDGALLSPEDVHNHNLGIAKPDLGFADLTAPPDGAWLQQHVRERLEWLGAQFDEGAYVEPDGRRVEGEARQLFAAPTTFPALKAELRLALGDIPIRCGPRAASFYKPDLNKAFDRNNCSTAHAHEPVQVLLDWPGPMMLARTRYSLGFIPDDAPLSPPAPRAQIEALVRGPHVTTTSPMTLKTQDGQSVQVGAHALLPSAEPGGHAVWLGTPRGVSRAELPSDAPALSTARTLTRREVLKAAFALLGQPYGWGGEGGGRDCSRFVMDVFGTFGLTLPRFSGHQAQAGTFTVDISAVKDERERLNLLDEANKKGLVLLYFPGHIMLYLGRNAEGQPMAIHSFAEYLVPCGGKAGRETLFTNGDVTVTTLELGRGTSRTAFLERITQLAIIGAPPGVEFDGVAKLRDAAPVELPPKLECSRGWGEQTTIFLSPRSPNADQPLRVMVTTYDDDAPRQLVLTDPGGRRIVPELRRTGGPPNAYIATLDAPRAGEWTAAFGDGSTIRACHRFKVLASPARPGQCRMAAHEGDPHDPVWTPYDSWGPRTESLYAAFVESLFNYPLDDDRTWTALQQLLNDPERNILFNHLSRDEERFLRLQPDCADLPYFLRVYFAWKMGLPFGYRHCNRGKTGTPPECGELFSNVTPCDGDNYVLAFLQFARRDVGGGVHSGHGRTHPENDYTDLYPVPMERRYIRPGTVYADPYGHLMVVTRWVPQTLDSYGILMAADAQPDGTIARRRFWQGTFLFDPDTSRVGAGFKAFRPVRYRKDTNDVIALKNENLLDTRSFAPWSMDQYKGTKEDFYDRMMALINPRPLDPFAMLTSLVDGLDEAANYRVLSVNNGLNYIKEKPAVIDMPEGYDIFETEGAWEDYSTPSRDMRLLIAIDTVLGFPGVVKRNPGRFGLKPGPDLDDTLKRLAAALDDQLKGHTITYTRSDGQDQTLTLKDIVDRSAGFEMSYNPNDCAEIRWAAPEGSDERASCKRQAPADQRKLMQQYRSWFKTRTRPSR